MCLSKPIRKGLRVRDRRICAHPARQGAKTFRASCFAVLFFCSFLFPAPAAAQTPDRFFRDDPETPWHIAADEIRYDEKDDLYYAEGSVVITKDEKRITADSVRFNYKAMQARAVGNVIITTGADILSGREVDLDLKAETGTVYEGTLFLEENHFYIRGDKIQKTGESTYTAENVSISTCDGESPDWKITGRKLQVAIEGYGSVTHAALWAKKLPVLYSPYLIFPAKLKRQSGFLPPQTGISDRKGFEYVQPYFWAISDSSDATFYFHHMEERGEKIGTEYRYILKDLSKGTVMFDGLEDRKMDDGSFAGTDQSASRKWGYEDDAILRPNADRYWFRMKHDQNLPYNFTAKIDLDVVSDQDYLTEFKSGYMGFEDTNEYFIDTYGRGLDDYNDQTRLNRLNLNRLWSSFSLNADARWTDDVIKRRWEETDNTLQELPYINFSGLKQPVLTGPFFFDLDTSYTHFYREYGTKGHRTDIYPRFYLPYKFKSYFTFEPSAGLRNTSWYISEDESSAVIEDRAFNRNLYDFRLDLTSNMFNIFDIASARIDRIKHNVRPQIVYDYTPSLNQDDYPRFDSIDRIPAKNLITYSITNLFTSRARPSAAPSPEPAENRSRSEASVTESDAGSIEPEDGGSVTADDMPPFKYHQFSRLKLQQSYDINKANDHDPEPFSPISAEFDWVPGRYFSLRADAEWSRYESEFLTHNVAAGFSDFRNDRLFIEHRYNHGQSETVYADIRVNLVHNFSVYGDYERNIFDGRKIKSSLGMIYDSQCWALNVRYSDEETDRKFEFIITLHGLGEAGTSLSGRTVETPFN